MQTPYSALYTVLEVQVRHETEQNLNIG